MTELFSNLGQTTINQNGGIGATDTSVTVASLNGTSSFSSLPSSGNFRVLFGTDQSSEICLCTAVNVATKTLTIVRGVENSTPQAWPNGAPVTVSITAQAINQAMAEVYQVGPYSAIPSKGRPTGSRYQPTDGHTPWVWNPYTGIWQPEIAGGVLGVKPVPAATFVNPINSPGSIIDSGAGALDVTGVGDAANTTTFRGFSFPFVGPGFVEMSLQHRNNEFQTANFWAALGPFFYETSSTKVYGLTQGMLLSGGSGPQEYMESEIYANGPNSPRTGTNFTPIGVSNGPFFIRIRRDFVNVYADFSRDRVRWQNWETRTIASLFTTAPDQIGLGGFSSGFVGAWRVLHFTYGPYPTVGDQVFNPTINILQPPPPPPQAPPPPTGWVSSIFH
jgi:hypothetical protein